MADWDADAPLDNSVVSQFPANERAARAALVTNFAIDHQATDGATVGTHKQVTLPERGSDPTPVTDTGHLYTKDVSGTTEVFYRDAAGNVVQLTTAGRVRGQQVPTAKTADFNAVAGGHYIVDKSGGNVTATLPASPSIGDEPIFFMHVIGTSNTFTIGRNANPIMALAENLTVDVNYAAFALVWAGASAGWRLGSLV